MSTAALIQTSKVFPSLFDACLLGEKKKFKVNPNNLSVKTIKLPLRNTVLGNFPKNFSSLK